MSKENETLTDIEEEIRADQDPYSAKIAAELDEQTVVPFDFPRLGVQLSRETFDLRCPRLVGKPRDSCAPR